MLFKKKCTIFAADEENHYGYCEVNNHVPIGAMVISFKQMSKQLFRQGNLLYLFIISKNKKKEQQNMYREHEYYLKRCIEVSKASREHGNTPFGAILVDEDGNILLEQENVEISTHKSTGHAETQLAEKASTMYSGTTI